MTTRKVMIHLSTWADTRIVVSYFSATRLLRGGKRGLVSRWCRGRFSRLELAASVATVAKRPPVRLTAATEGKRDLGKRVLVTVPIDDLDVVSIHEIRTVLTNLDSDGHSSES